MSFDKKRFAELLLSAKGKRSINKYSTDVAVDAGYISRLSRCLIDSPPSAAIIKKLGSKAANDITVEQLMYAAGYLENEGMNYESTKKIDAVYEGSDSYSTDPRIQFFLDLQRDLGVDLSDPENRKALKKAAKIIFTKEE